MGDSTSGFNADLGRNTLADKLIANSSSALSVQIELSKLAEMSEEQLREVFEQTDKAEREWLDKVGIRMNVMLGRKGGKECCKTRSVSTS